MRIITDIDDGTYKDIKKGKIYSSFRDVPLESVNAIANGTPIPDNATNGDVIKAMFPDAEIHINENDVFIHHMGFWIKCNIRWWNAPYQKGGK